MGQLMTFEECYRMTDMPAGKRKVLLAALRLFAANGVSGTSTAQIARAAATSQATIFKYYKTKQDLVNAVLTPVFNMLGPDYQADFTREITNFSPQRHLDEIIAAIIHRRYELMERNHDAFIILVGELMGNRRIIRQARRLFIRGARLFGPRLANLLQKFPEYNRNISVYEVMRIMMSQLLGYFMVQHRLAPGIPRNTEQDLDMIAHEIYRAITN